MAQLEGVNIEKLQGGLNRTNPEADSHFGYVMTGMASLPEHSAVNNNGNGVKIKSVFEAEALGFNESFDANNNLNYYAQIVEFFRLAPDGVLYLLSATTTADIKAFVLVNTSIKGYAVDFIQDGATSIADADIEAHQTLINELALQNRLIDFAVIGITSGTNPTLDLFTLNCPNVSVSLACEHNDGLTALGSLLGMLAVRKISENLGSVDIESKPLHKRGTTDYPLTDIVLDKWVNAYLPDGTSVKGLNKSELVALTDKGYVLAASYEGYPGFFFNNSYTAIERSSDFAYIENNRVWNKAARLIRQTLLPRVKSKVKKDPTTGYIASTTASYWETLLNNTLNQLVVRNDISGFQISIDKKQVVNSTSPVKIKALIVTQGIVHEFEVAVGLTNNI